jgi:Thermophilic metalloprotease (M29)
VWRPFFPKPMGRPAHSHLSETYSKIGETVAVSEAVGPAWTANYIAAGRLQPGERVLVVVDEPLAAEGAQLADAVRGAGGEPQLELWAGERPFTEPPPAVSRAAEAVDLCLFISQEPRGDEAGARIKLNELVRAHGGREVYSGLVDGTLLQEELSQPSPDLAAAAESVLAQLEGRQTVHVQGRAGTDLTFKIGDRKWQTDATPIVGGEFHNYPSGEVFVSPLEDGADGVLVADVTVPYTVDGLVDEPVTLQFEGGRAHSIEGGRAAALLRNLVDEAGDSGRVIAELGIGLNHAVRPRGHVLLDEKAGGTAHVAIGNNTGSYGGVNESTIHVDCIFSGPEIEADGEPVRLPPA